MKRLTINTIVFSLLLATSVWADLGWRGKPVTRSEQVKVWRTIKKVAKKEGVNPRLLAAIAINESGDLSPRLRGADGEYGFMQVMPFQAERINGEPEDLWDIEKQVVAAARHIKEQNELVSTPEILRVARKHPILRRHGLAHPRWLTTIGYNWGRIAYSLEKHGPRAKIPEISIRYAIRVRKIYQSLK